MKKINTNLVPFEKSIGRLNKKEKEILLNLCIYIDNYGSGAIQKHIMLFIFHILYRKYKGKLLTRLAFQRSKRGVRAFQNMENIEALIGYKNSFTRNESEEIEEKLIQILSSKIFKECEKIFFNYFREGAKLSIDYCNQLQIYQETLIYNIILYNYPPQEELEDNVSSIDFNKMEKISLQLRKELKNKGGYDE